jgi:predicted permease
LRGIKTGLDFREAGKGCMSKFIYSFAIILFGLSLGYLIQILARRGWIKLPIDIDALRIWLQRIALLLINPVAVVGAIWGVSLKTAALAALPFVGLFALLTGGAIALVVAWMFKMSPQKTGSMYVCGAFTNIGAIGALVCFVFLGEKGFALVLIYKLFEELSYYAIGFPVARYYSSSTRGEGIGDHLKHLARDPYIIMAVSGILIGALLNVNEVERPEFYKTIIAVFVPLLSILLLMSIGLALRFKRIRDYLRECVSLSIIKFIIIPILATALAYGMGFAKIDDGLPLKVVMILSCMPVAFIALIPPSIYDLDLDLANSCWLFTTALLVIVLPVLLVLINQV